jgi:hypothetical protein
MDAGQQTSRAGRDAVGASALQIGRATDLGSTRRDHPWCRSRLTCTQCRRRVGIGHFNRT